MDISRSSESSSSHSHSSTEPFGQRTASWALSLDNLLTDEDGIKAFSEFLERECSGENLAFWLDCRKLRSLTQPKEIRMKVRSMYSNYFALTAPQAINVDSEARMAADKDVLSPSVDAFTEAEEHIYQLMRDDSYPRFLRSDLYSQMVKGEITVMMKNKKDNHLFSRYKTTLKHKLSSSAKKRNKNPPSTPVAPLKQLNNNSIINNNNNNNYTNNKLLPPATPQSKIANDTKYTSSFLADETDINSTTTKTCLVNKFLSDWNLLEECEFDQFFSDIVSSSQRVPITTTSKSSQSTSNPCLIDTIATITRTIDTRSPSVGDLRPSVLRPPPPPPPPPPVPRRPTGKTPCPPPVPSRNSLYV